MIKAVIFDFDGTLMDTLPAIAYFGNTALAEAGLAPIETEKYKYLVGDGRDILIHRILDYHNAYTPSNYEKVGKKYDNEYEKDILFNTVVYEGITEMLNILKENHIKIAILTNKPHDIAAEIIHTVFGHTFDLFYGQRTGMPIKPAPDGALAIADELGFSPEECAFVGDTIVDITTGKNAGMYTIGVLWGFRDLDELSVANAVVQKPNEIIQIIKSENEKLENKRL